MCHILFHKNYAQLFWVETPIRLKFRRHPWFKGIGKALYKMKHMVSIFNVWKISVFVKRQRYHQLITRIQLAGQLFKVVNGFMVKHIKFVYDSGPICFFSFPPENKWNKNLNIDFWLFWTIWMEWPNHIPCHCSLLELNSILEHHSPF